MCFNNVTDTFIFCFRDLVKTAHLKPANLSSSAGKTTKTRIWNNLSRRSNNNQLETDSVETNALRKPTNTSSTSNHHQFTANHVPSGSSQFLNCWQQSDVQSRLGLLLKIGPVGLVQIFSIDMPTALLGEIFEALHGFEPTVEGIRACVKLLEALTRVRRFSLVIHFLNAGEKAACQTLVNKLLQALSWNAQDLAELGITEYSVQELGKQFLLKL